MFVRPTRAFLVVATALAVVGSPARGVPDNDVYVYVANHPGLCFLGPSEYDDGQVYTVFIDGGDDTDITGASFRIDGDRFGPDPVLSVTVPPGVTIVGGDIVTGITVAFPNQPLDHTAILFIEEAAHDSDYGDLWTRDITIVRGGVSEPIPDFFSYGGIIDCFGGIDAHWFPPDTVDVRVDKDESFSFKAFVTLGGYPPNGMVSASDANGWIPAPVAEWVWAGCIACPWDFTIVTVPVHVPKGVADGTLNNVTFQMLSFGDPIDEKTVVLRAVDPTATEETTWGHVKALYQ